VTCHLTGLYPDWWEGRRFTEPGEWWAAGDTWETTRDILQVSLMGPLDAPRTGMIPTHLIKHHTAKGGVSKGIELVWVQHASGGNSTLAFKSFDQGRRAFQGTKKQGIWLDEEMPEDVYTECLLRTMNTEGLLIVTFTPLQGLTPFVDDWLKTSDMLDSNGEIIPAYEGVWQAVGVDLKGNR
jgi:phage terminase large subunit-like protein